MYLFNINYSVFCAVVWWVAASGAAYLLTTIVPICQLDAPYYSPLSSLALLARSVILYPYFICLFLIRYGHTDWKAVLRTLFSETLEKMVEISARASSPEMDGHILKWTFDALTQDHDLDQFFNGILGFYRSNRNVVEDPRRSFARLRSQKFSWALDAFLDRTGILIDNLVSESDKTRKIVTCVKVAETFHLDVTYWGFLRHILRRDWHRQLSVEVEHSLRNRDNRGKREIGLLTQSIIAIIIADVQGSNDRWIALAADQLEKSENVIRGYLAHGSENILLANLLHITRQMHSPSSLVSQDMVRSVAINFPRQLDRFDVRATLLSLQHDLCALWNELIAEARNSGNSNTRAVIFRMICPFHIDLHPGTYYTMDFFDVSSYPLCDNPGHRPEESAYTPDFIFSTNTNTSPHLPDTSSPGYVNNVLQLTILPVSQQSHTIPDTSQHIVSASATPLLNESITTPPSIVPGSLIEALSLASLVSVPSNAFSGDLHLPVDPSMNRTDRSPHRPASSLSSPIADPSRIPPHAASFSNPSVTTSMAMPGMHGDIQDTNIPTFGG